MENDITIKLLGDAGSANSAIVSVSNNLDVLRKKTNSMGEQLSNAFRPMGQVMERMIPRDMSKVFTISDVIEDSLSRSDMNKTLGQIPGIEKILPPKKGFTDINNVIKDIDKQIPETQRKFQGWAMSIMFFGMALQKTFDTIWKSSTKTFQDISHSVEGTTTGFDVMEGSMKYLGFTVGQALEPIVFMLIPIVDKVADWVSTHEALTGKIVAGGSALGAIFAAGGGGALALNGFLELGEKITKASNGAIGVKEQLAGIVATGYAVDMGINLVEGDVFGAVASGFESAGLFALIAGKGKAGAILFSIGAAIDVIDAIVEGGGKLSNDTLAGLLMKLAPGILMLNPAVGAAVLTIGLGLTLLPDNFKNDFVNFLGVMFGIVATFVAAVIDGLFILLTAPINEAIRMINGMIGIINYFKDEGSKIAKIDEIDGLGLTKKAVDRLNEIASEISWSKGNEVEEGGRAPTTVTNNVNIVVNNEGELSRALTDFERIARGYDLQSNGSY